jgi:histone deacetylase 1/2
MMARSASNSPQFWLADSGATNHMTSEVQLLNNVAPYQASDSVQVGNGHHLKITHIGNTILGLLKLNNVLLIPELAAHLLSIYQLCKQNNCSVWFDEFMCIIQDKVLGKILYKGLSKQGLYPIPFDLPLLQASSLTKTDSSPSAFVGKLNKQSLWHRRFGHPSYEVVRHMLNKCNIRSSCDVQSSVCEPCLLGKFHKQPFPISQSRSLKPFELVHSDVWGPSPYVSLDGFRYYVLFVDDCTRYTWIFPMKNKNEVFSYFQSLLAFVKTQFSLSIKCLRTDGGGEYMSTKFKDFLTTQGIMHQVSCPHTPEQNGISERKNRHIRETAVTMIQTASVSSHFWYHACALATYLINRMPTPVLDMSSPFEKLYNKCPDLNILRVFGCACYPLLTSYRVDKLQPKTARCIFLGFATGYKGFICYNPSTKRYYVSRHVFFDEDFFPCATASSVSRPLQSHQQSSVQPMVQPYITQSQSFVPVDMPAPVLSSPSHSGQLSNSATTSTSDDHMSISHNTGSSVRSPAGDISSSHVENISPFSPHNHTSIQLSPANNISVSTAPGIGISVVLDCAPTQSTITSQISESNVLLPIEGLTNSITNDHSMLTRGKRGISKKKCLLSIISSCSDDPSDVEPSGYKRALQIPAWK